jgi:hypothetical protein
MKAARRVTAAAGIMFADEVRFGRMNRPRPCWGPAGVRPEAACRLIRKFVYLHGAVSPKDGASLSLAHSRDYLHQTRNASEHASKFSRWHIPLILDGAGNYRIGELVIPAGCFPPPEPGVPAEEVTRHRPWSRVLLEGRRTASTLCSIGSSRHAVLFRPL